MHSAYKDPVVSSPMGSELQKRLTRSSLLSHVISSCDSYAQALSTSAPDICDRLKRRLGLSSFAEGERRSSARRLRTSAGCGNDLEPHRHGGGGPVTAHGERRCDGRGP